MPLSSASILSGATITPSGGSALDFESRGISGEKNEIFVPADTDLRLQRSMIFSVKRERVSAGAPNGYTQPRNIVKVKFPQELENGNVTVRGFDISYHCDVESTAAEKLEDRKVAAQILTDSDFTSFWDNLSLS
jgi:hypothetical protein